MMTLSSPSMGEEVTTENTGTDATAVPADNADGRLVTNTSSGASSIVYQNYEASVPTTYLPGSLGAQVLSPSLFNIYGRPAQAVGFPMLARHTFSQDIYDSAEGKSGSTDIVYVAAELPKLKAIQNGKRMFYSSSNASPSALAKGRKKKVSIEFHGLGWGEVIGSLTIQTKKDKTGKADLAALMYDARHYMIDRSELNGYNITLLSVPEAISACGGVDTKSQGFSLSPLLSGFLNGPAGVVSGLASGFSGAGGVTVPTAVLGCTFLVIADTPNAQPINLYQNGNAQPAIGNGNGNSNGNNGANTENGNGNGNGGNEKKIKASTEMH
ncbi:hypothetical protein [Chlorobium limicola]